MNTKEKIARRDKLTKEVNQLCLEIEKEQNTCRHDWNESKYDPVTKYDWSYRGLEGHGSDVLPIGDYYQTQTPRWSRSCKCCGLVQYTNEQRPSGPMKPYFE